MRIVRFCSVKMEKIICRYLKKRWCRVDIPFYVGTWLGLTSPIIPAIRTYVLGYVSRKKDLDIAGSVLKKSFFIFFSNLFPKVKYLLLLIVRETVL